jgi:GNAT superfamily N-acetyltransferase
MNIILRNRNSLDDVICGQIMSSASKNSKEVNWLKIAQSPKTKEVSHRLFGNLRLIAILDGQAVGFTDYLISKCHIKHLFVEPQFQVKGIGTALLNSAQQKIQNTISVSVLSINKSALLWCIQRGFIITNCWTENLEGRKVTWLKLFHPLP